MQWKLEKAVKVDQARATAMHLQIARALEAEILSGRLEKGARLPTVREIAVTLELTTSVVQRAMAELQLSGLIVSQGSAGTFVAEQHEVTFTTEQRMRRFARQVVEDIDRLGYDRKRIAKLVNDEGEK